MEFAEVVRRRRMVRRYRDDPVDDVALAAVVRAATRGPSAGFSQGTEIVVLRTPPSRDAFWTATAGTSPPDAWQQGLRAAPVLLVLWSQPQRYLLRYAEADKPPVPGRPGADPAGWPVPWWDVDTGMAALLALLAAVDQGLGACLFGVPADAGDAVREALEVPADRRPVAVVAVGVPGEDRRSPSLRRGRRPWSEVVHDGRFGVPFPLPSTSP